MKVKPMKQMMMKEFMDKSKKKPEVNSETSESNMEDDENILNWNKEEDEKSRPATTRKMFHMNCHIQDTFMRLSKNQRTGG